MFIDKKYKPPSGPPQCHRCQQFGHVDKACNMNPKCVKCGLNHHTRDRTKPSKEKAVCANCKGAHPASYRGCPVYQRLKDKIKILKEKARLRFNPIPGYACFRRDMTSKKGGVCIFISNKLKASEMKIPKFTNPEAVGITIKGENTKFHCGV